MITTPRYRIGNDMTVLWAINNKDGSPYDMSGKEVRLFMTHRYGREEVACSVVRLPDGSVNNVIRWDFSGDDQKVLGPYALTVRIYNAEDMKLIRKDICEAFELVAVSCMECEEGGDAVINDGGDLILSSKLDIYRFGIPKIYIGSNGNWFIDGVDTGRSALGGGPGLVSRIYGKSDFGGTFDEGSVVDTFNAHAINDLAQRVAFMEGDDYLRLSNMTDVFFQGDLNDKDVLLFDGTYWTNVPLSEIGIGSGGSGSGSDSDYDALSRRIAVFEKMFYWFEDEETIGTKYNFFSEKENSAGRKGESIGTEGGGGIDPDELEDILNEKGYATEGYVKEQDEALKADIKAKPSSYVPLKTVNGLSLYGSGNIDVEGGGGSTEGLTAINVNDESFQPDENGIVTLPDYPSALPNPKALTFGSKTYNGSAARTITEADIVPDIETIRKKVASLENYDDAEIKANIATIEGHFTSGKAKDADKLDGYDSTYFATASSVSNLSGSVSSLGNDMANVKQDISEIENSISDINGDIEGITARVTKAEEDISNNKGNIDGIGEDVTSLMTWYNAVGSKFSKDADGTIRMEGDFYTTGENSAGGVGESVGGSGGGIDPDELDYILNEKGYATETWVKNQGFATGTIPTRVSQLLNDSGYITSADIPDAYTKDEVDNLLDGYTTTLSHDTLANRVAQTEKDISSNAANIATNATNIATNAANISENSEGIRGLDGRMQTLEEWWNTVGQYFKYDEANEAWYLDGNFYAKGENSAGGAGTEIAGGNAGVKNAELDFHELYGLQGTGIGSAALAELVGLTDEVIEGLLDARYNKAVGNGTYREVWSYTAYETQRNIFIYFRRGDGYNTDDWYYLDYDKTVQKWNITFGEI